VPEQDLKSCEGFPRVGSSPTPGTLLRGPSDGAFGGFEPEFLSPRNSLKYPNCARSVPAANSLYPTPANLEAIFHCFQYTSRLNIGTNCIAVRGTPMVGKTISHYKVLEKIGKGGGRSVPI